MTKVKPKKHLGQHFLTEEGIAKKIVDALIFHNEYGYLLEIGPGTGVLTKYLVNEKKCELSVVDLDGESIEYLKNHYPMLGENIIEGDFIKTDWTKKYRRENFGIIGNFPYNISSQIFFKILEMRNQVDEVVCMLQKEVAKE